MSLVSRSCASFRCLVAILCVIVARWCSSSESGSEFALSLSVRGTFGQQTGGTFILCHLRTQQWGLIRENENCCKALFRVSFVMSLLPRD